MAGLLDSVDQRTQLVGQNRLELLTFHLNGSQAFAINVFKVREVLKPPALTLIPHSHPAIVGVMHLRDRTVPVIDLSLALGRSPLKEDVPKNLIVTEYNRSIQAFLVGQVNNIVNMNWEDILPPPAATGRSHYLTAITRVEGRIVEIVDVERVLADIISLSTRVSDTVIDRELCERVEGEVLLVDDSAVALAQIKETLGQLGNLKFHVEMDGLKALRRLEAWVADGVDVPSKLLMVITDAEMPEMDGYRLTAEIRKNPNLRPLFVALHTSLSGSFNEAMVKKVGCDAFLSKFQPDDLALLVQDRLRSVAEGR